MLTGGTKGETRKEPELQTGSLLLNPIPVMMYSTSLFDVYHILDPFIFYTGTVNQNHKFVLSFNRNHNNTWTY